MDQQFGFKSSLFEGNNPNCLLILEFRLLFIFKLNLWFPTNCSDHPDHLSHLKMRLDDQDDRMQTPLISCRVIRMIRAVTIIAFILLHEKFLQFDWLRAVVFQLNLKYLHVKITNLLRVVV